MFSCVCIPLIWHYVCSENQGAIEELLVLEFVKKRSKNTEILELGLELGSL